MFPAFGNTSSIKTTSYKVVLPFYIYAALSFLSATILLLVSTNDFNGHYFNPHILAITHMMALGWGTMMILGASHQLVPVLIEGKLYSNFLAYATFIFAAVGIPLLAYGFYVFDMGSTARRGGELVFMALFCYLVNLGVSLSRSKNENVHAVFVFTAVTWLLLTALLGLALVYNFTSSILPKNSLNYLPLHAHAGIVGWFLLLVIGVGSRLIPMFLISKYTNVKLLWSIYGLINAALFFYTFQFLLSPTGALTFIPAIMLLSAVLLFIYYCFNAYKQRLRKKVDEQIKLSLVSVVMILLPVILLMVLIALLVNVSGEQKNIVMAYGFVIFFGWITAIILGMTFKTLPFIVWNKVYHLRAASGKSPNPKDLFSDRLFKIMSFNYIAGFVLFTAGILLKQSLLLTAGAVTLIVAAVFYNWNVLKIITHKPTTA